MQGIDRRAPSLPARAIGLIAILICALAMIVSAAAPRALAEDQVTVGGPFTLAAPDGATVTDESYRGKWLVVFFGYTFCPDTCPTTLSQIALALDKLGPDAGKVQPIFITVDPARDTPEVMGQYTEAFDPRIVGLSGSAEQIAAVSKAYGAYSERRNSGADAAGYLVDHSTYIYIMDPDGKFVRGLSFDTPSDDIANAVRTIIAGTAG
jgi:protein SCO1/2